MKLPIIMYEHGDVLFFASVLDAERYIEPIDVTHHEYEAYDSEGCLLQLIVHPMKHRDLVTIRAAESNPTHKPVLKEHLVSFFTRVGIDKSWLATASLEQLVAKGIQDHKTI